MFPDANAAAPLETQQRSEQVASEKPVTPPSTTTSLGRSHHRNTSKERIDLHQPCLPKSVPRKPQAFSKWPIFMRLYGSVMPKMIVPLLLVVIWSTIITYLSIRVYRLGTDSIAIQILGFVVALSLSFRSTTAYERYSEGRKYWSLLSLTSRNLARMIWVHASEREGEFSGEDLIAKISAINLILAFAVSLKHRLRFEPYIHYEDLKPLVGHLDTFAKAANEEDVPRFVKRSLLEKTGEYLGIPFATSNPKIALENAKKPTGNLPLEILTYLSAYVEGAIENETLKISILQAQILSSISTLNEVLTNTERILSTPLPMAYSILISQITWIYILSLPFQLVAKIRWLAIPVSFLAAYIILGIAAIGDEIENPFGYDINDLPIDGYCEELAAELDITMNQVAPKLSSFLQSDENLVLYPLSRSGYNTWIERSTADIRGALAARPRVGRKGGVISVTDKV